MLVVDQTPHPRMARKTSQHVIPSINVYHYAPQIHIVNFPTSGVNGEDAVKERLWCRSVVRKGVIASSGDPIRHQTACLRARDTQSYRFSMACLGCRKLKGFCTL
jgi:hypothetical protein